MPLVPKTSSLILPDLTRLRAGFLVEINHLKLNIMEIHPLLLHAHLIAVNSPNFDKVSNIYPNYDNVYEFGILSKIDSVNDLHQEVDQYLISYDPNNHGCEFEAIYEPSGHQEYLTGIPNFVEWTRAYPKLT